MLESSIFKGLSISSSFYKELESALKKGASCFQSEDLHTLEPCLDSNGKLIVCEGKSSRIYQMRDKSSHKKMALKCYHWNDPVLELRYQHLTDIKKNNDLSFIVPCKFIPQGTTIHGETNPVLLMDWIEGVPFREFINRAAGVPRILDKLARLILRIDKKMYRAGLAHCCIEPDHIMLGSNASDERGVLILLDYDNIWVPSLAHRNILEISNHDYQHPGRVKEGIYGPLADRFPLLLLYTSLTAIRIMGTKFLKDKAPEHGLLFSKRDLEFPNDSQIFKELLGQKDPFLRGLILEIQDSLAKPMAWIPSLEDSINKIKEEADKGSFGWAEVRFDAQPEPPTEDKEESIFGLKETIAQMAATAANRILHGDFEAGIQLYIDCCERDPGNLACRKKLRDAQMKKLDNKPPSGFGLSRSTKSRVKGWLKSSQFAKALEAGEEGLSDNPWDSAAMRVMGRAADGLGFTDTASWLFQSALKISPNDLEILQDLAEFLERQQDFRSARILWEKILRLNPSDQEAKDRAKELGASETMKRMTDNKDVVITSAPKEVSALAEEQRIRTLLQEKPHWAPYYIELTNLLKKANRLEEAEHILRIGIVQSEGDKKLLLEVAHLEKIILGKRIDELKHILSVDKTWAFAKIAEDCLKTEQRRRDSELLRLRVEADPANMASKLELGQMLVELGEIDAAISELQQSRKDPRLSWKALISLGKCFSIKGNATLARRNLEDALKSLPETEDASRKEILFSLALSYASENDFTKAVEIGNEIANIDFTYQGIGKLLDEWMLRSKQG